MPLPDDPEAITKSDLRGLSFEDLVWVCDAQRDRIQALRMDLLDMTKDRDRWAERSATAHRRMEIALGGS